MGLWNRLFGQKKSSSPAERCVEAFALRGTCNGWNDAEKMLRNVVRDTPDFWLGHYGIGETLFHNRDVKDRRKSYLESSVEALERAIHLRPEQPEPRLVLASLLAFHKFDEAAFHYQKATEPTSKGCDEGIYGVFWQAQDHWEFALAAAKNGELELSHRGFENALTLNHEYRTTPPASISGAAALECWTEAALRYCVTNLQALSESDAHLWRLWLRKHRLKLYQQGPAAFTFLIQRSRERYPDFPAELLELATFPVGPNIVREVGSLASTWSPDESTPPQALVDMSVGVRGPGQLIRALAEVGDRRALQPLLAMFERPTAPSGGPSVTLSLIYALGKLGNERAIKALIPQLDREIGNAAARAIADILVVHATEISESCLKELLGLKHEYRRTEVVTDQGTENEWTHVSYIGVDVSHVKERAQAELDRRRGRLTTK